MESPEIRSRIQVVINAGSHYFYRNKKSKWKNMNYTGKKEKLIILTGLYILASLALRLYYLHEFSFSPLFETPRGPDVEEYCRWAKEITAGRILWTYVKIHSPLYSFFLALLYFFFANIQDCFYYIRLTQILLGFAACIPLCGTILLIYKEQN